MTKILPHSASHFQSVTGGGLRCHPPALLSCLLPIFIDLMMDNAGHDWAMPHYPVVD